MAPDFLRARTSYGRRRAWRRKGCDGAFFANSLNAFIGWNASSGPFAASTGVGGQRLTTSFCLSPLAGSVNYPDAK